VEVGNGWYYVIPTATESNTDGPFMIRATGTGANEWRDYHQVYTAVAANTVQWHGSDLLTGTGPLAGLGVLDRGTAQSDSTTTLQLRSAATFANDELIGATALIYSASTGAGQRSLITDYVSSTDTATIDTLVTDPTGTVRYEIYGTAASSGGGGGGLDAAGVRAAVGLASANLDTQLAGIQNDTNDIQTRIPAALVSGRIDASVGAMAANVLTAAATAADFSTEVYTAFDTQSVSNPINVNVIGWNGAAVDPLEDAAEIADVLLSVDNDDYLVAGTVGANIAVGGTGGGIDAAGVRAAIGLTEPDLGARLTTISNKTNQLTFTKANELDANVQSINNVTIIGNGQSGSEFGV
jgi:hypothetical protein